MNDQIREYGQENIRLLAVKALSDIHRKGGYANLVLQDYIRRYNLEDLDRRFFTELVYGVVRRRNYLDAVIVHFANRPLRKLSSMAVEILRLGIYQLLYMDKIPESAAVNESVKIAKKLTRGLHGFINAILRSVIRKSSEIGIGELARNESELYSFIYNQPLWLVELWQKEWGTDKTAELLNWFNQQPKLTARINILKISKEDCIKELKRSGWTVSAHPYIKEAIYIDSHTGQLEESDAVVKGYISFMDIASMLVARLVNPKRGDAVLDCCAAPGGKSMHMAAMMHNEGSIVSCDVYDHKVDLIKDNAARLGATIVEAKLQDARHLPDSWRERFNRVLVDAPCSGLGILQKKLDMRWRKEQTQLTELPPLQKEILQSASAAVKPGGYLIYSTCTLNRYENREVVEWFLKRNGDFSIDEINDTFPVKDEGGMITTYPPTDDMDGFFMVRMKRAL